MGNIQTRNNDAKSIEDFPTPPWATRAMIDHSLPEDLSEFTCWEPCANRGYMVNVLRENFGTVIGSDIADYGAGFPLIDFLTGATPMDHGMPVDYIITNPPFNLSLQFYERWLEMDVPKLYMLLRTNWVEGIGRYKKIFSDGKLVRMIQYAERVPILEGRLDKDGVTQMPYAWFAFDKEKSKYQQTRIAWIPPCRKDYDYETDWPE